MKKILYLGIGVIVALGGAFLVYFWWTDFVIIFKGLIGPMIIMAGAIVFIVGLMTPFKEEEDNLDSECSDLEDELETDSNLETTEEEKTEK